VQASAQRRWNGGGQGADQDAVVDDVPEFPVQPQSDPATGQGLADADVTAGDRDQSGRVDHPVDLDRCR
jgi:hypothetical protein